MVDTNNHYLREIAETVSGESIKKHISNNHLLRIIASKIGASSTSNLGKVDVTITYTDSTSETVSLAKWSDD